MYDIQIYESIIIEFALTYTKWVHKHQEIIDKIVSVVNQETLGM